MWGAPQPLSFADIASSEQVQVIVDLDKVLTPEQRQSLVGMAACMRH